MYKIGIIGGGNGGISLYCDFLLRQNQVTLYYDKNFATTISPILKSQNIIFKKEAAPSINIDQLNFTNDLLQLLNTSDYIFNTLPITSHLTIYKQLVQIINQHSITKPIYLINLGGGFSPYFQLNTLNRPSNLHIGSTASFPYACRVSDNIAKIYAVKKCLDIAFIDNDKPKCLDEFFISGLNYCDSILEVGLKNVNPINHPIISLFNITRIDSQNQFKFYAEGITPSVSNILSSTDHERVTIAAQYGYQLLSDLEQDNQHYGTNFSSYCEYAKNTLTHSSILSPLSTKHRYIIEDIPFGLVPLASLASLKNIPVPHIVSVIQMYNTINKTNYHNFGYVFTPQMLNNLNK